MKEFLDLHDVDPAGSPGEVPLSASPYRPRPAQQGSLPQIGAPMAQVAPMGSQQQQPLQSVHAGVVGLGTQAVEQLEPPPDDPELLDPLEPPPSLAG